MNESLLKALEDPQRFHYKDLWLKENNPNDRVILELFAFGKIEDAPRNMVMTTLMLQKLQKLTIISLSEQYRELSYDLIQTQCGIADIIVIEEYLIQLQDIFQVKLNSVLQSATIVKWFDCRDVYSGERELQLVKSLTVDRSTLIRDLKRWKLKLQNEILGES